MLATLSFIVACVSAKAYNGVINFVQPQKIWNQLQFELLRKKSTWKKEGEKQLIGIF